MISNEIKICSKLFIISKIEKKIKKKNFRQKEFNHRCRKLHSDNLRARHQYHFEGGLHFAQNRSIVSR